MHQSLLVRDSLIFLKLLVFLEYCFVDSFWMAASRVDRISSVHWWLPHKDIGVMLRQAHSTFSDDFQGEEIQVMMEKWVENVCRLSEGDMRDLLSLVKEFSLD